MLDILQPRCRTNFHKKGVVLMAAAIAAEFTYFHLQNYFSILNILISSETAVQKYNHKGKTLA